MAVTDLPRIKSWSLLHMKKFGAKTDICLARCYWHAPLKFQGADDARASPHSSASLAYRRKKMNLIVNGEYLTL